MRRISLALALVSAVAVGCTGGVKAPPASTGIAKGVTGQYYYVNLFSPPVGGIVTSGDGLINCGVSAVSVNKAVTPWQYAYAYYGAGATLSNKCGQFQYQWDQTVTLTAAAQDSNTFIGWAGDCSGTAPCGLANGADKSVVAIFGSASGAHMMPFPSDAHGPVYAQFGSGDTGGLQCNTCHGTTLAGLGMAPSCAACHNVQAPEVAAPFVNSANPSGSHGNALAWTGHNTGTCARCHTSGGYRDYIGADGTSSGVLIPAANQYLSSSPAATNAVSFTAGPLQCNTCHNAVSDPMVGTLRQHTFPSDKVVTTDAATAVCIQCHDGGRPGYNVAQVNFNLSLAANNTLSADNQLVASNAAVRAHYLPAASTFFGSDAANWYQYPSKVYTAKNEHGVTAGKCTSCHDPHGQKVVNVTATSCGRCHFDEITGLPVTSLLQLEDQRQFGFEGDIDGDGVQAGLKAEIDGLGSKLYAAIQAYATNVSGTSTCVADNKYYIYTGSGTCGVAPNATAYNKFTPRLLKAAYNYLLYQNDTGGWAHNPRYEIEILFDTIADVNAGLVAKGFTAVPFAGFRSFNGHFGGAPSYWTFLYTSGTGFTSPNCYQCHGGKGGFAAYLATAPAVLTAPVMTNKVTGMQCTTCHAPAATDTDMKTIRGDVAQVYFPPQKAGAANALTVAFASTALPRSFALCATCHSALENAQSVENSFVGKTGNWDVSFVNPHYLGAAAVLMGNETKNLYQYPSYAIGNVMTEYAGKPVFWKAGTNGNAPGPHGSPHGAECTGCHQPKASKHTFEIDLAWCGTCHVQAPYGDFRLPPLKDNVTALGTKLYATITAYTQAAGHAACYNGNTYPYWFQDNGLGGAPAVANDGVCAATESAFANSAKLDFKAARAAFNYKWSQAEPGAYAHNYEYMVQAVIDAIHELDPAAVMPIDAHSGNGFVPPNTPIARP